MAKLERVIHEDIYSLAARIENGILGGSMSASLEDSADYRIGEAKCCVRVFERYSSFGGNRVSLRVTLFQAGDSAVRLCAVASGGSQAVFFKLNTLGEENFLAKLEELL